jgi:hypothetical protein
MKTAEEVLDRLGRLSAADRAWLLQALSDQAKARLRQVTAALQGHPTDCRAHQSVPETSEELAQQVAWLAAEPAWILALVLGIRPGPWQGRLLARLAPEKRREVMQLRAGVPPLSKKMEEALGRVLAEQASGMPEAPLLSFEDTFERERVGGWRRSLRVAEVGT